MNQPVKKSSLSAKQAQLVSLLQNLNFGRVENLRVSAGEPIFDPAPRVVRKVKIGGENGPRSEADLTDFLLKRQTSEMLETISQLGDGQILSIEVKHGLPFAMEVELGIGSGVWRRG